jgi:putative acetyltransferase
MVAQPVPLGPHHVEQAKGVIRQVWREHFGAHGDPYVRTFLDRPEAFPDLDTWNQTYAAPSGLFLVALDAGCVVGTGGIRRVERQVAELTTMFLVPEYRGRGLGRSIAEHLIQFARHAGTYGGKQGLGPSLKRPPRLRAMLGP